MISRSSRQQLSRGDAIGLGVTATGAVSVAISAVVLIIAGAFEVFGPEHAVRMPMVQARAVDLGFVAGIRSAESGYADVVFDVLPTGARWMLLLEGALPAVATIGVCAAVWWLGVSLLRGRPFRRTMSATIGIAACLVAAGGLFGQVVGAIGRAMIVENLASAAPGVYEVFPAFSVDLDLAPLGWGLALALLAVAFQFGTRLQRETEGLV